MAYHIRRWLHAIGFIFTTIFSVFTGGIAKADSTKLNKTADAKKKLRESVLMRVDPAGAASDGDSKEKLRTGEAVYNWRKNIVATTFWVGEEPTQNNPVPNHASSWDTDWAKNYGGYDDPDTDNRQNYIPADFTPRQNPFYVALPYNDLQMNGYKDEAEKVVPWFEEKPNGEGYSTLKGTWIAIRYKDRVCYAQWEDCGPFRTDNWEYVFGYERPKPNLNKGAGLDVSPAVRDYLGMKSSDVVDWRFVKFEEIPSNGPWAKHGDNNTFVQNKREQQEQLASAASSSEDQG